MTFQLGTHPFGRCSHVGAGREGPRDIWYGYSRLTLLRMTFHFVAQSYSTAARVDQLQVHRLRRSRDGAWACRCYRYHSWDASASLFRNPGGLASSGGFTAGGVVFDRPRVGSGSTSGFGDVGIAVGVSPGMHRDHCVSKGEGDRQVHAPKLVQYHGDLHQHGAPHVWQVHVPRSCTYGHGDRRRRGAAHIP